MKKELTVELLQKAYLSIAKEIEKPWPCIDCGELATKPDQMIGLPGIGIGRACDRCFEAAQDWE